MYILLHIYIYTKDKYSKMNSYRNHIQRLISIDEIVHIYLFYLHTFRFA